MNEKQRAADLKAAYDYRVRLVPKADGYVDGVYPWWHGWAIREAYLAGLKAGRKKAKSKNL